MSPLAAKLLNVLLYQAGWFACVLGAAWNYPIIGGLGALALAEVEAKLMLCACLIGFGVDSRQHALGVFTFKTDPGWPLWLPLWVFVIWLQFATLFHYALSWLSGRYLLASLLGMLGGPLAYWGGVRLGAAVLGKDTVWSLLALGLAWALVTPLLVWLSDQFGQGEGSYCRWSSR